MDNTENPQARTWAEAFDYLLDPGFGGLQRLLEQGRISRLHTETCWARESRRLHFNQSRGVMPPQDDRLGETLPRLWESLCTRHSLWPHCHRATARTHVRAHVQTWDIFRVFLLHCREQIHSNFSKARQKIILQINGYRYCRNVLERKDLIMIYFHCCICDMICNIHFST